MISNCCRRGNSLLSIHKSFSLCEQKTKSQEHNFKQWYDMTCEHDVGHIAAVCLPFSFNYDFGWTLYSLNCSSIDIPKDILIPWELTNLRKETWYHCLYQFVALFISQQSSDWPTPGRPCGKTWLLWGLKSCWFCHWLETNCILFVSVWIFQLMITDAGMYSIHQ